jgi:hypothetical protein
VFSTENLRVGDKVIVVHGSIYSGKVRDVGEIVKKTPAGKVDVRYCAGYPQRYYKDGSCYATASNYLEEYSKEAEEEILRQKKLWSMQRWLKDFDYTKLSYEEAEQVYTLVAGLKNS